jgi:hypothetical protein
MPGSVVLRLAFGLQAGGTVIGVSRWLSVAAAAGSGLVLSCVIAGPAPALSRPAGSAASGELVYVASVGSGPVTAYAANSSGSVTPARTVDNPNTAGTVWDPWGVTFDATGHLYVQSFLANATTFVFPPGASGGTLPSRIFEAQGPDNSSIAVDAQGFEYVLGGESGSSLAVAPPGASGTPGNSYFVPPVRTIVLDGSFNPWPGLLTVDSKNEVLAAVGRFQRNAIEVFAGGAGGGASPVRVISGPHTGLDACSAPCKLSITFSPFTGRIYAAVSTGATTHISVFAGNANGDTPPVRTIEGPATGLAGMVITGIADSQLNGTIYAMVKTSQFGTGRINAYGRLAHGNVAPLRSFSDSGSGFANAAGIAITKW